MGEAERFQDVVAHVREERLAGRALDHRRHEVPAVTRIRESRPGLEQQGVVLEDRQRFRDRREAPVEQELVALIVPNARQVAGDLPRRDRPRLLRERRHVALHRCIEIELPLFHQQRHGGGGERLGDAPDPELREPGDRDVMLDIREPERFRPHELAVHRHGHLQTRDALREAIAYQSLGGGDDGAIAGFSRRDRGATGARTLAGRRRGDRPEQERAANGELADRQHG
jgi:hypothetical protein